MKRIFLFTVYIIVCSLTYAQTGNLRGTVSSENEPLPGVNIFLPETGIGGVSDEKGRFSINSIPAGIHRFRFSAVGYETKYLEFEIQNNRTLEVSVRLNPQIIQFSEVEIIGSRDQKQSDTRVSLLNVPPRSVRKLPGAATDVMRSLQSLPGVLAPNDFTSQLVIRGSGPDQNLIIMDDVEIFNPYRLYGVISMFNPEAVSDISLITGGFPARYGDRLSAVLDITNREGPMDRQLSGNLNASIVSANLVLEGKNPFNLKGSWLFNSRRTYYDLIIEPFVKNAGLVEDNVSFPNFYDFQSKLVFGPFSGHKFLLNGIYSRDGVNIVSPPDRKTADSVGVFNISRNDVASFAWHYSPNRRLLNKFIVSWYRNGGDTDFDSEVLDPSLNRNEFENTLPDTLSPYLLGIGFKSNISFRKYAFDNKFTYLWGSSNELEAGMGFDIMRTQVDFKFDLDPLFQSIAAQNPNFRSVFDDIRQITDYNRLRFYVNNNFSILDKLFIQPGLRLDHYNILRKTYLAPRIALSYTIGELTTIRGVWGIYYQSPGFEKIRDQNVLFDLSAGNTGSLNAEKAIHYVLSLQRWISGEWSVKVESYYKDFSNLIVQKTVPGTVISTEQLPGKDPRYVSGWSNPVVSSGDSVTSIPINNSSGEAYGFEFMLEKRNVEGDNTFSGWISYALAYASRYEEGIIYPFRFDQRHTLNIVLNYKPLSWFEAGLRFQYGSGFPQTEPVGITPRMILTDTDGDGSAETPVIATRNSFLNPGAEGQVIFNIDFGNKFNRFASRKPDYHRLDIRLTFYSEFWGFDWTFYLDVINVYNRKNVIGYDYYIDNNLQLKKEANTMFPILPTFGFSMRF